MNLPYEKIVISRINHDASATRTLVMTVPPTIAEHNVILACLRRIKHEWPGAWACAQQEDKMPALPKMKEVSREHFGLPAEEPIQDVPA